MARFEPPMGRGQPLGQIQRTPAVLAHQFDDVVVDLIPRQGRAPRGAATVAPGEIVNYWPVAILAGNYAKVWAETNVALDQLGIESADRAAILGDNAAALYSRGEKT